MSTNFRGKMFFQSHVGSKVIVTIESQEKIGIILKVNDDTLLVKIDDKIVECQQSESCLESERVRLEQMLGMMFEKHFEF